jgi:hypothetical protein
MNEMSHAQYAGRRKLKAIERAVISHKTMSEVRLLPPHFSHAQAVHENTHDDDLSRR